MDTMDKGFEEAFAEKPPPANFDPLKAIVTSRNVD